MTRPVVIHSDDLPWEQGGQGEVFSRRRRRLGRASGGQALGCSMIELLPGKTAWPFHYHCGNEEAIYVLSGRATLRLGAQQHPVRAGDYVALPAGPQAAHQLINTSGEPVRYLVLSTMTTPEVAVYPDSNKVGVVGALTDDEGEIRRVVAFPTEAEVGYWHGEPTDLDGDPAEASADSEGPEHPATDSAATRAATIEAMVEDDLSALKQKLGLDGSGATPPPTPSGDDDPAPTLADEDLDALKQKLNES